MYEQKQPTHHHDQENERYESVRPLGDSEHLFWLLDQNRSIHFAMVAEIDRHFPTHAWNAALISLQRRHPLLSTCIFGDAQACAVTIVELHGLIRKRNPSNAPFV